MVYSSLDDLKKQAGVTTTQANSFTAEQDALKNIYDNTVQTNQQTANTSYQQADILNQKLAKYIPTYNKAQGINGGLSESSMLKANANVQSMYADINTELGEKNKLAYQDYMNLLPTAQANDSQNAYNSLYDAYTNNIANNSQYTMADLENIYKSKEYNSMTYADQQKFDQLMKPYYDNIDQTTGKNIANGATIQNYSKGATVGYDDIKVSFGDGTSEKLNVLFADKPSGSIVWAYKTSANIKLGDDLYFDDGYLSYKKKDVIKQLSKGGIICNKTGVTDPRDGDIVKYEGRYWIWNSNASNGTWGLIYNPSDSIKNRVANTIKDNSEKGSKYDYGTRN